MRKRVLKKGVSPVIATVLLIAIVIVIGLIIFLWFKGMTQEAVTKFGKNVELSCEDSQFDASYSGGILTISNLGNVPIFNFNIRISEGGNHVTQEITEIATNWPETGLKAGGIFSNESITLTGNPNEIVLSPILVGRGEKGKKSFECNMDQHGYKISIS